MIIIYNFSGLLVGLAGLLVGGLVAAVTGKLSIGVLALAAVWIGLGLLWRKRPTGTGARRPYPALFFVPLPFLAALIALLAVPMLFVESAGGRAGRDPRAAQLKADEEVLDAQRFGGDAALSERIASALAMVAVSDAKAEEYHVYTRVNPDALLVLVKAPNLRTYKETARVQLLRAISDLLAAEGRLEGKRVFIGVKGKVAFGAVRVPPDLIKTGSVVNQALLYDFYGGGSEVGEGSTVPSSSALELEEPAPVQPEAT